MRVIAGSAGGLPLKTPKTGLRPTMDKVRGAIFDSLGEATVGARVLDLFAGSGALGIEALSRGAASATFVESDRRAVACLQENLTRTTLEGEVFRGDVFSYLDRRGGGGDTRRLDEGRAAAPVSFDLIFADPPYAKAPGERDFGAELLTNAALRSALAPDGFFILEHLPHVALALPPAWYCVRDKRYGATAVAFLRLTASSSAS